MKTSCLNLETKSASKPPKQSSFPPCTADNLEDFQVWYNKILAILATSEWSTLFDQTSGDVVPDGSVNTSLNSHLYSLLVSSMKKHNALIMQNKKHLYQDGISFLRSIRAIYQLKLSKLEVRQRYADFTTSKIKKDKTIDMFAARLVQERELIQLNWKAMTSSKTINHKELKDTFIFGLSPAFIKIKERINDLPVEWQQPDLESLIPVAKQYLKNVEILRADNKEFKNIPDDPKKVATINPTPGPPRTRSKLSQDPCNVDRRLRVSCAISQGSFKLPDFQPELPTNHCLWHGAGHHSKDCKTLKYFIQNANLSTNDTMQTPPLAQPTPAPPTARATTVQPTPTDNNPSSTLVNALDTINEFNNTLNSTNNIDNQYIISCKNITLTNNSRATDTDVDHNLIIDSAAWPHLFHLKSFFVSL